MYIVFVIVFISENQYLQVHAWRMQSTVIFFTFDLSVYCIIVYVPFLLRVVTILTKYCPYSDLVYAK